jgi:hypothetical protein
MKLDERLADDGALWVFFIPTGTSTDPYPPDALHVSFGYV